VSSENLFQCISLMKMSPQTAVLRCHHYERGHSSNESDREAERYHLLKMVLEGKASLKEASRLMGVSYRQAKRLKKKLISQQRPDGDDTPALSGWVQLRCYERCALPPHSGQNFDSEGISLPHDAHLIKALCNLMRSFDSDSIPLS